MITEAEAIALRWFRAGGKGVMPVEARDLARSFKDRGLVAFPMQESFRITTEGIFALQEYERRELVKSTTSDGELLEKLHQLNQDAKAARVQVDAARMECELLKRELTVGINARLARAMFNVKLHVEATQRAEAHWADWCIGCKECGVGDPCPTHAWDKLDAARQRVLDIMWDDTCDVCGKPQAECLEVDNMGHSMSDPGEYTGHIFKPKKGSRLDIRHECEMHADRFCEEMLDMDRRAKKAT